MRCKNCGTENSDNLYICQNCGSPLYDEEDINIAQDGGTTQVFGAVGADGGIDPDGQDGAPMTAEEELKMMKEKQAEDKKKQTIAIIVILVVLLLAIIIGTVIAVVNANNKDDDTTLSTVKLTTTEATTKDYDTDDTTTTTTEESTEPMSTTDATTTTEAAKYKVSLTASGAYGDVDLSGDGEYAEGTSVTVSVSYDDSSVTFVGWYEGNNPVSTNKTYTFTIKGDMYLTAIFEQNVVDTGDDDENGGDEEDDGSGDEEDGGGTEIIDGEDEN